MKQSNNDKLHLKESEVPESTNESLDFSTPEALTRAYYFGKNATHGKTIVTPGYYFIKELLSSEADSQQYAHAYWHPFEASFISEPLFKISLNQLKTINSRGHKEVSRSRIVNSVIQVESVDLIEKEWNQEKYKSYEVKWRHIRFSDPCEVKIVTLIENQPAEEDANVAAPKPLRFTQEENDALDENELLQILLEYQDIEDEENEKLQLLFDEERDDDADNLIGDEPLLENN